MVSIFGRWRARTFAALVDRSTGHGQPTLRHGPRHRVPSRLDRRLATLVALSEQVVASERHIAAGPDPSFRVSLRATLMATAEREGIGAARAAATRAAVPLPATTSKRPSSMTAASKTRRFLARGRVRNAFVVAAAACLLALANLPANRPEKAPGELPPPETHSVTLPRSDTRDGIVSGRCLGEEVALWPAFAR